MSMFSLIDTFPNSKKDSEIEVKDTTVFKAIRVSAENLKIIARDYTKNDIKVSVNTADKLVVRIESRLETLTAFEDDFLVRDNEGNVSVYKVEKLMNRFDRVNSPLEALKNQ